MDDLVLTDFSSFHTDYQGPYTQYTTGGVDDPDPVIDMLHSELSDVTYDRLGGEHSEDIFSSYNAIRVGDIGTIGDYSQNTGKIEGTIDF